MTASTSTSRNETQEPEIKLAFSIKTDGEFWYLHGEQVVPGLNLTGPDLGKVLADVLPAWRALHRIAPQQVPEAPRTSLHSESVPKWKEWGDFDTLPKHGSVIASGFDPDGNSWIEIVSAQWLRNGAPMDFATHWMPLPVAPHRQGAK